MSINFNKLAQSFDFQSQRFQSQGEYDRFAQNHYVKTNGEVTTKWKWVRILDKFCLFKKIHRFFCGIDIDKTKNNFLDAHCKKFNIKQDQKTFYTACDLYPDEVAKYSKMETNGWTSKNIDEAIDFYENYAKSLKGHLVILTFDQRIGKVDDMKLSLIKRKATQNYNDLKNVNIMLYKLDLMKKLVNQGLVNAFCIAYESDVAKLDFEDQFGAMDKLYQRIAVMQGN